MPKLGARRKKFVEDEQVVEDLNGLLQEYVVVNRSYSDINKRRDELGKQIKKLMASRKIDTVDLDDVKVRYILQERTTMDEPKAVEVLKSLGLHEGIKTIEVLDQAKVEDLIYQGKLAPMALESCVNVIKIETLRVFEKKEGQRADD